MRKQITKFLDSIPEHRPMSILELRVLNVETRLRNGEALRPKDIKVLKLAGIK